MQPQTITQHFLNASRRPSGHVALRFKRHKSWIDLNWLEYYRQSEAIALALSESGVRRGDRVAVWMNTRYEWATVDFAVMGLGAVTVPIYPNSLPHEVEFILNDSQCRALLVESSSQLRKWEAKKCKSISLVVHLDPSEDAHPHSEPWDAFLNRGVRQVASHPDFFAEQIGVTHVSDLASIVYTSGTTGEPKGVQIEHEQIVSEVEDLGKVLPITWEDTCLSFLPYAHVMGRVELWLHTYMGFTLAFAENIDRLKVNLHEVRPTLMIGVPRIFEKIFTGVMSEVQGNPWRQKAFRWLGSDGGLSDLLLKWPKHLLADTLIYRHLRDGLGGRLRFAVSGGAPLERQIGEFFFKAGILILEGYGLTETTAAITLNTPDAHEFGTVGRPLGEAEIKLADDGEILVRSRKVMRSYLHQSPETSGFSEDDFFATGDIGHWTQEGYIKITDRKKDLIKTAGGKYVAPQKLEGLLKLDPLISHVLITGDRKKYITALITLNEPYIKKLMTEKGMMFRDYRSLSQSKEVHEMVRQLVAQANTELASYETIKNFTILDHDFSIESGELTPSLKVKRRLCDERYKDKIEALYN